VVQLHQRIDELHATGAEVFVIGNGSPSFMDGFRETTGWRGPLYTDPSLEVYKAAGLKRGVTATLLDPRAAWKALGALRGGSRQGRTQGDQWQQGGVIVVAPSGDVIWSQVSEYAGDNAAVDEILEAVRRRHTVAG
jgi:hypothetical protein